MVLQFFKYKKKTAVCKQENDMQKLTNHGCAQRRELRSLFEGGGGRGRSPNGLMHPLHRRFDSTVLVPFHHTHGVHAVCVREREEEERGERRFGSWVCGCIFCAI